MSDDPVRTIVQTKTGECLGFRNICASGLPAGSDRLEFIGADTAKPIPAALDAIQAADLVILAPSNPWVSIAPILAVPGYLDLIRENL